MLGGISGPYLVYLIEEDMPTHSLTYARLISAVGMAAVYMVVVYVSFEVAGKFGKTPAGILATNTLVFITMIVYAFGSVFLMS